MIILPKSYEYDTNGFIRQKEHDHFPYTVEYRMKQSTNIEMSFLRLGWISSFFSYDEMQKMDVVDVGCGSGIFMNYCSGKFRRIVGYDVVGESITEKQLYGTIWDLVVLSDVLEHFDDIEDLFRIKWKNVMLSFPETPKCSNFDELSKWRHFKPNEHLYYLDLVGVKKWLKKHDGVEVIGTSNFEDLIRKRWDKGKSNISSILARQTKFHAKTFRNNPISK